MKRQIEQLISPSKLFSIGLFSALTSISLGLLSTTTVSAQKRTSTKKVVNKKKSVEKKKAIPQVDVRKEPITSISNICIPRPSNNVILLQVDKNLILTVSSKTVVESKVIANAVPLASLDRALSGIDKSSVITVKPDPNLSFDSVANFLRRVRQVIETCVNVEASTRTDDQFAYILPEPKYQNEVNVKPNPLTLVAQLDESGALFLNNEEYGSIGDPMKMTDILKQIFKARAENGVFRENSSEIETTVFVKSAKSRRFGDVIRFVDALKESGASPIGLQIDDLEDSTVELRMEMTPQRLKKPNDRRN